MIGPDEPVIATVGIDLPGGRGSAVLADVLIVGPDHRRSSQRCAELFARYPGLTLTLIPVAADTIDVGLRDGSVLRLQAAGVSLRAVADLLYFWWCCGHPQLGELAP